MSVLCAFMLRSYCGGVRRAYCNTLLFSIVGKTTSVMCLARELLGDELLETGVMELNASDERGIDVVRNKIKMFAQRKVPLTLGIY